MQIIALAVYRQPIFAGFYLGGAFHYCAFARFRTASAQTFSIGEHFHVAAGAPKVGQADLDVIDAFRKIKAITNMSVSKLRWLAPAKAGSYRSLGSLCFAAFPVCIAAFAAALWILILRLELLSDSF